MMGEIETFYFFIRSVDTEHELDEIIGAVQYLSRRKIGALIVMERETGLKDYLESGYKIDAGLSKELLISIFNLASPLHDGGVVTRSRTRHQLQLDGAVGHRKGGDHSR